ncbi:hypothetical protein IEQ34_014017 [Dendrobium chrysotoxum]|uniref:Uncharacterized protein n=1 Tax=Dendrobium chrysotoxum TaxID=161865 RepID=A0AAV7GK11_DENCH|nr:hypothetical protein IEQ34_014017 [Dendrobium chrysotoxum]
MAILSLSLQKPTPRLPNHFRFSRQVASPSNPGSQSLRPIFAIPRIPSTPPTKPPGELYQPFRPPPSPLPPKYRSLGPAERLEILRNRLGLWHEYAPLISSLSRDGFTPPSIEEITGITGVEQNRFAVASQVRDSLLSPAFPTDILAFFDASSGADLLYELRLLNAAQRAAAACHVVHHRLDPKAAQELARAIKDFSRRRGEEGWECFSAASPGDCLAYSDFRLSREATTDGDRVAALEKAMKEAESDGARRKITEELEKRRNGEPTEEEMKKAASATVPVVRLRYGEVSEASSVVLLPVCRAEEGGEEVEAAPAFCKLEGAMGVVKAERRWGRWIVLPGWGPAAEVGVKGGVAVEFLDGRVLPWRKNRWEKEEAVLVVVDRKRIEVEEEVDELYLVRDWEKENGLTVERGKKLLEMGRKTEALGAVVLVVRPPKEAEDGQLNDDDWE